MKSSSEVGKTGNLYPVDTDSGLYWPVRFIERKRNIKRRRVRSDYTVFELTVTCISRFQPMGRNPKLGCLKIFLVTSLKK